MSDNINFDGLYEATHYIAHNVYDIGGRCPSTSRIWDECIRAFDNPAVVSVNFNCRLYLSGIGLVDCIATIGRDGSRKIARKAALDALGIDY